MRGSTSSRTLVALVASLLGPSVFGAGAPLSVSTSAPTSISGSGATLNGAANPNGATTTGFFRYSTTSPGTCDTTFGTRAPSNNGAQVGSGTSINTYKRNFNGLIGGTTYYVCAVVTNSYGTVAASNIETFNTSATAPTVTTDNPASIASTTATLQGLTNPRAAATTGFFRYSTTSPGSCNNTFGTRLPASGGAALGAGTANVAHSEAVTGLSGNTMYYYCALGTNTVGTSVGTLKTFTTLAAPEMTTSAASAITAGGATLNGTSNPGGALTTGYFRYSSVSGTCSDSYGIRAPVTGGVGVGSGRTAVSYSTAITGLAVGTTYYYCAAATNSEGTSFGSLTSFTTAAAAPMVTTSAASSIDGVSATLNGSASPEASATTGYFRYSTTSPGTCNDSFGTRAPTSGGTSLGAGTSAVSYAQTVVGLSNGTVYYFCAIANNAIGTSSGSVQSFTTLSLPTVTTVAASSISPTQATLNGTGNPAATAATGWIRYSATDPGTCSDSFGTRLPASGGVSLGAGSSAVAFSQLASGLVSGATYYYCAIAQNAVGTSVGTVVSFTVAASAPTTATVAASSIAGTTATLNASVNPNGAETTVHFRYRTTTPGTCDDAFGTRTPSTGGNSVGSGIALVSSSQAASGLSRGTTYYFCAIASNSPGLSVGTPLSFTTLDAPSVTTSNAGSVSASGATLNGSANPRGASSTGFFRYSTTNPVTCNNTFGTRTPGANDVSLGAGTNSVAFSIALTSLASNTSYYVCALATNSEGTSVGSVTSFTTPAVSAMTAITSTANTSGQITLTWSNPVSGHDGALIVRATAGASNSSPVNGTSYLEGSTLGNSTVVFAESASVATSFTDTGLTNGTTYYYKVFNFDTAVAYSSGDVPTSSGLSAVPTDAVAPSPAWCYSVGLATVGQPYTEFGTAVYSASNAQSVTGTIISSGITRGTERWRPVAVTAVVQARPAVVPLYGRTGSWILIGDHAGRAYAIDAQAGTITWTGNAGVPLGDVIQAQAGVQLNQYANATFQAAHPTRDLVYFATRNSSTTNNQIWALSSVDGSQVWTYSPGNLDIVSGGMMVDYDRNRLWVASRAGSGGTQPSLRVIDVLAPSTALATFNLGDIDNAVVKNHVSNEVYVATNAGVVYGFNQTTLAQTFSLTLGQTINNYIVPVGQGFIVSTTAGVQRYAVDPTTHVVTAQWPNTTSPSATAITGPSSARVDSVNFKVYVGDSNGAIHRLNLLTGVDEAQVSISTQALGTPSLDVSTVPVRLYVGALDGRLCALNLNF